MKLLGCKLKIGAVEIKSKKELLLLGRKEKRKRCQLILPVSYGRKI